MTCLYILMLMMVVPFLLPWSLTDAWTTTIRTISRSSSSSPWTRAHPHHRRYSSAVLAASQVLDADFEHIDPSRLSHQQDDDEDEAASLSDDEDGDEDSSLRSKSLFELSLEADAEINDTRIPFLDYSRLDASSGTNYIDVKLAFLADLDGVQYGIAVPFDHVVAVTREDADGNNVEYLAPQNDDNEEIVAIMAQQLQDHVGSDLQLQQTPRVLTVVGPLDNYTQNWESNLLPEPFEPQELLKNLGSSSSDDNNENGDLEFFHQFMKDELGEKEYEKTMNETPHEDDMEELVKLFDVPGLGDRTNDDDMEELMKSILNPEEEFEQVQQALGLSQWDENANTALRLVSYIFPKGSTYSLVKLLKPYAVIAKFVNEKDDSRFELLTPDEEKVIIPRLEQVCQQDLEKAGLTFETVERSSSL